MKVQTLTKAIALVTIAGASSIASANVAEKTGSALANMGDSIFSGLTGKQAYKKVNHPVSLYDYDEADSSYEEAYINGRLNAAGNPNKVAVKDNDGNVLRYDDQQASYNLTLDTNYEKVISTKDSNLKFGARADATIGRASTDGAETEDNWNASADVNYDKYFTEDLSGAFWYGKGDIKFQEEDAAGNAGIENPAIGLSGGVGYGRVVNVTDMARSIRLIEALVERGILKTTPSKAVYKKIATITSKESEYQSKYGAADYAQYWIKDVEKALGQNIGANGAIKAYEVLTQENISTRKYGWDVRAGLGAQITSFAGTNDDIKPLLTAEANYHYPVGLQGQFSNEATFTTVLDDDNNSYNIDNLMSYTHEVSDRVDWVNKWNLKHVNNENAANVTSNDLSTSYVYKISNTLAFDTTLKLSHTADGIDDNDTGKVDTSLTSGITYRLK